MNMMRNGKMPTVTMEQAQKNYRKVRHVNDSKLLIGVKFCCHLISYLHVYISLL